MKVFLGGTCNGSTWREALIPKLQIDFFNPVVEDWTPECQEEELKQRQECDYCLYVITSQIKRVYSIAEVVDDSNKRPEKTVFCILSDGFEEGALKSLKAVRSLVEDNGANCFDNLVDTANFLNQEVYNT